MARRGLAFNQRDASSLSSESDRSGTACHSTTKDQNFVLQSIAPNSLDVPSICSGTPYSSRPPNSKLDPPSVQIGNFEAVTGPMPKSEENLFEFPGGSK